MKIISIFMAFLFTYTALSSQTFAAENVVNDKKDGFSAYNLPQGDVKQKVVGQIFDRIYVPADAPVTGEQYSPIENTYKPAQPTPPPAAPVAPTQPVVAPTQPQTLTYPTNPVVPEPAATAPVQAPEAQPTPTPVQPTAPVQTMEEQAPPKPLANVPTMTPTRPNQAYEPPKLIPNAPPADVTPPVAPPAVPQQETPVKEDVMEKSDAPAQIFTPAEDLLAAPSNPTITDMPIMMSDDGKPNVDITTIKTPAPADDQKSFGVKKKENNYNLN